MKLTPLGIDGAWLAESPIWNDDRGFFREWFKSAGVQATTGIEFSIQQANISQSSRDVIRGIHYSLAPAGQSKWITCVSGAIKDVIVDIRPNSQTYGKWEEVELNDKSGKAVFISEGLGHGFLTLQNNTTVAYLLSTPYSEADEYELNPFDSEISINWGIKIEDAKISTKDLNAPSLETLRKIGKLPKGIVHE
jgi:dTDP-4-dehydrorhamnose 3,5-epimerase